MRYDRDWRPRYDDGLDHRRRWQSRRGAGRRYDAEFYGVRPGLAGAWGLPPLSWSAGMPGMEMGGFGAYPLMAPGHPPRPARIPPERSPAYGRGADRELRRRAERLGYDAGFRVRPRQKRD